MFVKWFKKLAPHVIHKTRDLKKNKEKHDKILAKIKHTNRINLFQINRPPVTENVDHKTIRF